MKFSDLGFNKETEILAVLFFIWKGMLNFSKEPLLYPTLGTQLFFKFVCGVLHMDFICNK